MKNQKSVQLFEASEIQSRIVAVRNVQVMLDRDLAVLYGVQTKVLNQAVKRNIERFPDRFMFRLVESEMRELVTNCDRFETLKHSGRSSIPECRCMLLQNKALPCCRQCFGARSR